MSLKQLDANVVRRPREKRQRAPSTTTPPTECNTTSHKRGRFCDDHTQAREQLRTLQQQKSHQKEHSPHDPPPPPAPSPPKPSLNTTGPQTIAHPKQHNPTKGESVKTAKTDSHIQSVSQSDPDAQNAHATTTLAPTDSQPSAPHAASAHPPPHRDQRCTTTTTTTTTAHISPPPTLPKVVGKRKRTGSARFTAPNMKRDCIEKKREECEPEKTSELEPPHKPKTPPKDITSPTPAGVQRCLAFGETAEEASASPPPPRQHHTQHTTPLGRGDVPPPPSPNLREALLPQASEVTQPAPKITRRNTPSNAADSIPTTPNPKPRKRDVFAPLPFKTPKAQIKFCCAGKRPGSTHGQPHWDVLAICKALSSADYEVTETDFDRFKERFDEATPAARCARLASILKESRCIVDRSNDAGWTALFYLCAATQNLDVVLCAAKLLLKHGANPNTLTPTKSTPLLTAASNHHIALCSTLLEHDATLNDERPQMTPLMCVASLHRDTTLLNLFLSHGADTNRKEESQGWTALQFSLVAGNIPAALVLAKKTEVGLRDSAGMTALMVAVCTKGITLQSDRLDLISILLQQAKRISTKTLRHLLTATDLYKKTALIYSIEEGHTACALRLLEEYIEHKFHENLREVNEDGNTVLHLASMCGSPSLLRGLLDAGLSLAMKDAVQCTPLHIACEWGNAAAVSLFLGCVEISEEDIAKENSSGDTPLSLAKRNKHTAVARLLEKEEKEEKGNRMHATQGHVSFFSPQWAKRRRC